MATHEIDDERLEQFEAGFHGDLIRPDEPDYDAGKGLDQIQYKNTGFNYKRPYAVCGFSRTK